MLLHFSIRSSFRLSCTRSIICSSPSITSAVTATARPAPRRGISSRLKVTRSEAVSPVSDWCACVRVCSEAGNHFRVYSCLFSCILREGPAPEWHWPGKSSNKHKLERLIFHVGIDWGVMCIDMLLPSVGYAWLPLLKDGRVITNDNHIPVTTSLPAGYLSCQENANKVEPLPQLLGGDDCAFVLFFFNFTIFFAAFRSWGQMGRWGQAFI